jgi:hypothetical protein
VTADRERRDVEARWVLESARATARAKDGALEAQKAVPLRRRARTEQRRE